MADSLLAVVFFPAMVMDEAGLPVLQQTRHAGPLRLSCEMPVSRTLLPSLRFRAVEGLQHRVLQTYSSYWV